MNSHNACNTPEAALTVAENLLLDHQGLAGHQVAAILDGVMQSGIDDADIYFQATRSEGWSLEEGIVKAGSFSIDQGVGVRAISGEKTAFAYSDDVSLPSLKSALSAVREIGATGNDQSVDLSSARSSLQPAGSEVRYLPLNPI